MPQRRVIIAFVILILLGGLMIILYGLLGGTIGRPVEPQSSLLPVLSTARQALSSLAPV